VIVCGIASVREADRVKNGNILVACVHVGGVEGRGGGHTRTVKTDMDFVDSIAVEHWTSMRMEADSNGAHTA
jgi:hypothetical protein